MAWVPLCPTFVQHLRLFRSLTPYFDWIANFSEPQSRGAGAGLASVGLVEWGEALGRQSWGVRADVVQGNRSQVSVIGGQSQWLLRMAERDPQGENWKRQIYPMGVEWEVGTWVDVGRVCKALRVGAPQRLKVISVLSLEGRFLCKWGCTGGQKNILKSIFL